jgi:hypothetical protein
MEKTYLYKIEDPTLVRARLMDVLSKYYAKRFDLIFPCGYQIDMGYLNVVGVFKDLGDVVLEERRPLVFTPNDNICILSNLHEITNMDSSYYPHPELYRKFNKDDGAIFTKEAMNNQNIRSTIGTLEQVLSVFTSSSSLSKKWPESFFVTGTLEEAKIIPSLTHLPRSEYRHISLFIDLQGVYWISITYRKSKETAFYRMLEETTTYSVKEEKEDSQFLHWKLEELEKNKGVLKSLWRFLVCLFTGR